MTVHFVCRGNVFRSIVAEAYLRSLLLSGVTVLSSGTVAERDREVNGANFPRVRSLLARHKLEDFAKDHYGDPLTQKLLDGSDIVIFMNRQIFNEAVNQFQVSKEKIQIWNITDPGEHNFTSKTESEKTAILEKTYGEIVKKVNSLAGAL